MQAIKKKILYFVAEDWFFFSHFLERAQAARAVGHDVVLLARCGKHKELIEKQGIKVLPLRIDRGGMNPLSDLMTLIGILGSYISEKPDLVHHIALKPILYGSLAARMTGIRRVVNAPVGMGYLFTDRARAGGIVGRLVFRALRKLMRQPDSHVIVENHDDLELLVREGFVGRDHITLIRGAGINLEHFVPTPEPSGEPVVSLVSRMLRDKGIHEFVSAAALLRNAGVSARFRLIGAPDLKNPSSLDERQLQQWASEGIIEWLGYREDISELLAASSIVCLPSYREGLPKALLEALACGRAVVATDVPGCREVVIHEYNGLLVPAKDASALAEALRRLIENPSLRREMGQRGRQRAEKEFSSQRVIDETLAVYTELLAS